MWTWDNKLFFSKRKKNTQSFLLTIFVAFFALVAPNIAHAVCTSPAGTEGQQVYNTTHNTMQFCDGTNWIAMKGGSEVNDVLTSLSCASNQIAKWNGSAWACAADNTTDNLGNHTATTNLNMSANRLIDVGQMTTGNWHATYDAWLQGGVNGATGGARNLALLGHKTNDTLYLNYNNEYAAGTIIGSTVRPFTAATYDLGTSGVRWRHGYFSGNLYGNGANLTSLNANQLASGLIPSGRIGADSLTAAKIAPDAIGASELADNSVASVNIINGTITNADIASMADTKLTGVPTCTGADKALQWAGAGFTCATVSSGGSGSGGGSASCTGGVSIAWGGCSGTISGSATHGGTSTATDSSCCNPGGCGNSCSGNTGTGTFTCNNGAWSYTSGPCNSCSQSGGSCPDRDEAREDLPWANINLDTLIEMGRELEEQGKLF